MILRSPVGNFLAEKTNCSLCGRVVEYGEDFVSAMRFITDATDPLWRNSNSKMHRTCFLGWELRGAFVEKYNAIVGPQVAGDGTRYWMQPDGEITVERVGPPNRGGGQPPDGTNILGELDDRRFATDLTQRELAIIVRDSLTAVSGELAWNAPDLGDPRAAPEHWFTISSPHPSFCQRLVLDLRWDSDLQVEHHHPLQRGGPLEHFWLVRPPYEADGIREAVGFAADIVAEAVVLVRRRRQLIWRVVEHMELSELASGRPAGIEWVRSWRGTHDWTKT